MSKDPAIFEAIERAGGVGRLARAVGVSQPAISQWRRVPAERVLAVEAATGVPRERLRPDLFSRETTQATQAAE